MQERKQPLRFRLRSTTSPYTGEALLVQPSSNSLNSNLSVSTPVGQGLAPPLLFDAHRTQIFLLAGTVVLDGPLNQRRSSVYFPHPVGAICDRPFGSSIVAEGGRTQFAPTGIVPFI